MKRLRRQPVRILGLLVGSLALAVPAAAGIRATVNRSEAALEDQILLTLTVEGSRSARPTLPELNDFDVHSRGQSTQMSFVNGQMTSSISHSYVLIPRRTGILTIGPATVELDGVTHSSQPLRVRIVEASEQPQEARDLFVTAKVSTTTPFVGQEVLYIWRFYRRVRIGDARLEPQEFSGFQVEDLGEVREYRATVSGIEYLVSEIRKALFPQEPGALLIPPSRLTLEVLVRRGRSSSPFDDIFGSHVTETKVLRSPEIELEVQPLPAGPQGFTGLVGDFDIDAQISKAVLQVGESATLKVTVGGSGNVQMITEPALPALPDFKIYDDRPVGSIERSGPRLTGSRTFSKALVPLAPGEQVIPPIELSFFDPEGGEFRQARTAPIALQIEPAPGREDLNLTESVAPTTGKVSVRILADDLLPIYRGLDAVHSIWAHPSHHWWFWVGMLLPPVTYVGIWWTESRRRRFASDDALRRRHHALRRLRRDLRELTKAPAGSAAGSRLASRCLRQYIGDKLGVEGLALTADEIDRQLRAAGVKADLVESAHELLLRLEIAQFGGETVDAQSARRQIESLVRNLERQLR